MGCFYSIYSQVPSLKFTFIYLSNSSLLVLHTNYNTISIIVNDPMNSFTCYTTAAWDINKGPGKRSFDCIGIMLIIIICTKRIEVQSLSIQTGRITVYDQIPSPVVWTYWLLFCSWAKTDFISLQRPEIVWSINVWYFFFHSWGMIDDTEPDLSVWVRQQNGVPKDFGNAKLRIGHSVHVFNFSCTRTALTFLIVSRLWWSCWFGNRSICKSITRPWGPSRYHW